MTDMCSCILMARNTIDDLDVLRLITNDIRFAFSQMAKEPGEAFEEVDIRDIEPRLERVREKLPEVREDVRRWTQACGTDPVSLKTIERETSPMTMDARRHVRGDVLQEVKDLQSLVAIRTVMRVVDLAKKEGKC